MLQTQLIPHSYIDICRSDGKEIYRINFAVCYLNFTKVYDLFIVCLNRLFRRLFYMQRRNGRCCGNYCLESLTKYRWRRSSIRSIWYITSIRKRRFGCNFFLYKFYEEEHKRLLPLLNNIRINNKFLFSHYFLCLFFRLSLLCKAKSAFAN